MPSHMPWKIQFQNYLRVDENVLPIEDLIYPLDLLNQSKNYTGQLNRIMPDIIIEDCNHIFFNRPEAHITNLTGISDYGIRTILFIMLSEVGANAAGIYHIDINIHYK